MTRIAISPRFATRTLPNMRPGRLSVCVRRPLSVALAVLGAALAAPAAAPAALQFERCGGYGYSCARMSVPLDRSGAVPGRVSLRVQRVRSRVRPARGAVFVLAGGPGQSATAAFAGDGVGLLYPAYRRRDVIVFDQRGTGLSGAIRCRAMERANLFDAGVAGGRCAAALGARRAFYTTPDTVEDMEAIRRAARVCTGSRCSAPRTARRWRWPTRCATRPTSSGMVLDSVVEADGPGQPLPRHLRGGAARPARGLRDAAARRFTRDPVADLQTLVRRLGGGLRGARGGRARAPPQAPG